MKRAPIRFRPNTESRAEMLDQALKATGMEPHEFMNELLEYAPECARKILEPRLGEMQKFLPNHIISEKTAEYAPKKKDQGK